MSTGISRRTFVAALGVLGSAIPAAAFRTHSQNSRVPRIGIAIGDDSEGGVAAFRTTLRERGLVEGRDIVIEARTSQGAPPGTNVAADLARMNLALVVVHSLPLALAARAANPAMTMVVVTTPGMVSNGFAASMERPGGNVTGIDELPPGVTGRRLELLKSAAPAVTRVALLSTTPGSGGHEQQFADAQEAGARLGVAVKAYRAASVAELEQALAAIAAEHMHGLLNFQGGLSYVNRQLIVDFAAKHRIPAIYQATAFAAAGGLMAWAPNLVEQWRMAAGYVDQILKGARAGDLPVRHPPRYFLTVNNTAARNLGLVLPPSLLSAADRLLP